MQIIDREGTDYLRQLLAKVSPEAEADYSRHNVVCRSAQAAPEAWHIPVDEKVEEQAADDLRAILLPHVIRHWEESIDPRGRTAITPDVYLKDWERSNPRINSDFILFDEAQDSDGLMLSVLRRQRHAQVIYVGDPYQQIYEWRGAVNAMEYIKAQE